MPPETTGPSERDLPFLYQQQFMRTTALVGAEETYQDRLLAQSRGSPRSAVAGPPLARNQGGGGSLSKP